jgi:hypothetical protein
METRRSSIELAFELRRSMEEARTDLVAKFDKEPSPELARMIWQLELEIAERTRIAARK